MIFPVDWFFIIGMAIIILGLIGVTIKNLDAILGTIAMIAAILFCLFKWPRATFVILCILGLAGLIYCKVLGYL